MPIKIYKCVRCGVDRKSYNPGLKYCSQDCKSRAHAEQWGRITGLGGGISTGTVGALSEMGVALYFMEKGYAVFRALSPSCYCDLVCIKDVELKVEVRTAYRNPSTGNINFPKQVAKGVDVFALYFPKTKEVSVLDVETLEEFTI